MADITKPGTSFTPVFYDGTTQVSVAKTVNGATIATPAPPTNVYQSELNAGEAIAQFDACYIKPSDDKVWRSKINLNAPPAAPTLSSTASGVGLWNGNVKVVTVTYVTAEGESTPSVPAIVTITTTGSIRVAAIGAAALDASITAVNYYVENVLMATTATSGGTAAQTDISGASLTLSGLPAPTKNTAYKDKAYRVDGYAQYASASGEAVTLVENIEAAYPPNTLGGGSRVYLSGATAGALADAKATNATGQDAVGKAIRKISPFDGTIVKNMILWASRN